MNIIDINNKFLQFIRNNPYEGFRLNGLYRFFDYEIEGLLKFADDYDGTGELTLLYLASECQAYIDDTIVSVGSALANPGIMEPYSDCKALIDSPLVKETRQNMADKISAIIAAISGRNLLGDGHAVFDELDKAVHALFKCFRKLRFEVYMNSGRKIEAFNAFSPSVHVSHSLAELLLRLEASPDGISVGYVSNPGTLDGWFGFFCKSNGNLFSYNERIDEAYVGQHRNLRNGRYAEDKAFDLFPYELCKFSDDRDYKGYSREITIGSNLNLFDMEDFSIFVRTVLSMAVISRKHEGRTLEGKAVVVDSLLPANLARLCAPEEEKKALVKLDGSQLVKASASFKPPQFEAEKVLRGFYDKEFCHDGKRAYNETGWFTGVNQEIVDAYGDGFEIDNEQVLCTNSSRRLIGEGTTEQEFIGSPGRFRLRAYMEVRRQLANHVRKKLLSDFDEFGGVDGLKQWYKARLAERMDKVLSHCADTYKQWLADKEKTHVKYGEKKVQDLKDSFRAINHPLIVAICEKPLWARVNLSEYVGGKFVCPVFHCKASLFFRFEFGTYTQVQEFLGCELPKFCVGWRAHPLYNGNSLLDVTDPVGDLVHPIYGHFNFSFSIGLCKRAIAKATKEGVGGETEKGDVECRAAGAAQ